MGRKDGASKLHYMEYFGHDEGLTALLLTAHPTPRQPLPDGMDRLLIAVYDRLPEDREIELFLVEDTRIQVRRVRRDRLENALVCGNSRDAVRWLAQGEILFDRDGWLAGVKERLESWSDTVRERKLLCEFSRFVRTYMQAKQDLQDGQVLDAYSHILSALLHWAHIALVEEGLNPELTVWEQMKHVNLGIYKLYEELTTSPESLEKRVQLLLLACEFSMLTKMRSSCSLLIRLLGSRSEPWTIVELMQHPDLNGLRFDLALVLSKLVKRGYIRETARSARHLGKGVMELRYSADV